jgi:hypothetical protein
MLTARDLARHQGIPLRTAQRMLARWYAAGHATKVPTGGRDAFAIDAATLARLTGGDGAETD